MKWLAGILILLPVYAGAEVVRAVAQVEHIASAPFSCKILRHRVKDRLKGHAGLHALLLSMEGRDGWKPSRVKRLAAYLGRSGYFAKSYFEPGVKVSVRWPLSEHWASVMNSQQKLAVQWSFKKKVWQEESGILPDEVHSVWQPAVSELQLWTMISPLELCFGPGEMFLNITSGESALHLRSRVEWE